MNYPDLEIYLKHVTPDDVLGWLQETFEPTDIEQVENTLHCKLKDKQNSDSPEVECTIVDNAVQGGFTAVWFKPNHTVWKTDENCALDAFSHLGTEVRCSTGNWQGEDQDGWLSITANGRKTINWRTD